MRKLSTVKCSVITALCTSLCIVLPMAFHAIPQGGVVFAPMHIPVLLCGLICPWPYGLFCGLAGPLISSVLTGMPAAAILPAMMIECAVYGTVCGIMMKKVSIGKPVADVYISMVTAMAAGRIVSGLARAFLFSAGGYTLAVWAGTYFVTGLPGLIIQLALVPAVMVALYKAKLIPERY